MCEYSAPFIGTTSSFDAIGFTTSIDTTGKVCQPWAAKVVGRRYDAYVRVIFPPELAHGIQIHRLILPVHKQAGFEMRFVSRVFLTAVLAVFCSVSVADRPGLVKEKPKSGRFVKTDAGYMVPYTATIPGTEVTYEMVPIPGGVFTFGSPASEANRKDNEGPQIKVKVEPFWMGKYEVTWAEYKLFMGLYDSMKDIVSFRNTLEVEESDPNADEKILKRKALLVAELKKNETLAKWLEMDVADADAITAPTRLYEPSFTFEKGQDPRQPAVTMTQYAAKQYTKWLSLITSDFYRIPTEAEWEYACRAGTNTAYSFGDDPAQLKAHAWYVENSDERHHKVGQLKPNPWGLYDIHGNAAEWVIDQLKDSYPKSGSQPVAAMDAVAWPDTPDPRVVRGGHWDSSADEVRSASRLGSNDEEWKTQDPNIPLSPWWFTDDPSRGVGMRLMRPLKKPSKELVKKFWEIDAEDIEFDVEDRLAEGRGVKENVAPQLPLAIEQVNAIKKIVDPK